MFKSLINSIMSGNVTLDEAYSIGQFILSGEANEIETAALLTALNFQEMSFELITGFAQALKLYAKPLPSPSVPIIDVCGTGGDGSNTFNISTTVSLLLSSVIHVSKHGNRSISSKSGSADVLRQLRIPFYEDPGKINKTIETQGYAFLFAPLMHPNMKYVMPVRTTLKIPTVFNVIGPLCNPHRLDYQVIGVYKKELVLPIARAVLHLGVKRAAVVHGHKGLDELSITGTNEVLYVIDNQITHSTIDPKDFNIPYHTLKSIQGGDALENARITESILEGQSGPHQDVIALNAGLALFIAEKSKTLEEGIALAYQLLNSGIGIKTLNQLRSI